MTSLEELLTRVSELRKKVATGETNIIDQDLQLYFEELSSLIRPDKLEQGIAILKDSTTVLEEKFEAIQQYIQELLNKDRVIEFLNSHPTDTELADLIDRVSIVPMILPQCSISFLDNSFSKLVSHKPVISRSRMINSDFVVSEKQIEVLANPEDPFERRMLDYFASITSHLPATIDDLLKLSVTKDEYFENFSYLLHLLQNGILWYEKPSRQLQLDHLDNRDMKKKKE